MYEITGLANLSRLKVLSMRNNDLTYVSGLETLSALVELDVGENRLTRLGEGLENLVNLRKLGVAQNQITTLDGLEPLQALDELDARDNAIERVREVEFLERLPLFSSLLLQGNPCSDLPFYRRRVVFRLQQLRTLDGIAVTSDDKVKAINLHGGDESDLKHRRETFRKHFGSSLEFEDPLPPFPTPGAALGGGGLRCLAVRRAAPEADLENHGERVRRVIEGMRHFLTLYRGGGHR